MAKIAIFGSKDVKANSFEWQSAKELGNILCNNGFDLILSGNSGIMEAAFINCDNSIKKIHVMIEGDSPNQYANEVIKTKDYFSRLIKVLQLADAYIILPGGTDTFLGFAAAWALSEQSLIVDKPLIAVGEMWSELVQTMAFYNESIIEHFDKVTTTESAEEASYYVINYFKDRSNINGTDI